MKIKKEYRRYDMKKITKEDITSEFIESLESDLELLKSREPELTQLVIN